MISPCWTLSHLLFIFGLLDLRHGWWRDIYNFFVSLEFPFKYRLLITGFDSILTSDMYNMTVIKNFFFGYSYHDLTIGRHEGSYRVLLLQPFHN